MFGDNFRRHNNVPKASTLAPTAGADDNNDDDVVVVIVVEDELGSDN